MSAPPRIARLLDETKAETSGDIVFAMVLVGIGGVLSPQQQRGVVEMVDGSKRGAKIWDDLFLLFFFGFFLAFCCGLAAAMAPLALSRAWAKISCSAELRTAGKAIAIPR